MDLMERNLPPVVQIVLSPKQRQLYLHIYDTKNNHVGFNPLIASQSKWQIEFQIPDASYEKYANGTTAIILPADIGNFKVVVDGSTRC